MSGESTKGGPARDKGNRAPLNSWTVTIERRGRTSRGKHSVANHLNVSTARLAGDNALDMFQKHREKELKERRQTYW